MRDFISIVVTFSHVPVLWLNELVIYFGADNLSEEKIGYMQRAYDGPAKALANSRYLCGENLTIADLCCVKSVSAAPTEEDAYANVKGWVQRLSELPYYKKISQEQVDILVYLVKCKLEENKKAWENVEENILL